MPEFSSFESIQPHDEPIQEEVEHSFPKLELTNEQKLVLLEKYKAGDEAAGEQLIASFETLIEEKAESYLIAENQTENNDLRQDLLQEGRIAALQAAQRFEPKPDSYLASYANNLITQAMLRVMSTDFRMDFSVEIYKDLLKLQDFKEGDERIAELARNTYDPGNQGKRLSLRELQKIFYTAYTSELADLEANNERLDNHPLVQEQEEYSAIINEELFAQVLTRILSQLTEREQLIIEIRYGLDGAPPATTKEAAALFGIAHTTLLSLERRALTKLARFARSPKLRESREELKRTYKEGLVEEFF